MGKRRGHGEGSIHLRNDGRWCASIDLGLINGKRKRKYVYGETRKEVADKLKAIHALQASGGNVAPERTTVKQFLERWLSEIVERRNKPRTTDGYKQIVRDYLTPHLGHHTLQKLTPEHLQAMLNAIAEQGRAENTVRNVRAALRRALNQAMRWGYVTRNVATLVDVSGRAGASIAPLDERQARALLDAVSGHRLEALYRIALSLGLRRSEVLGLLWSDVDAEGGTLHITGSLQRIRGQLVREATTKTEASMHPVPLPPALLAVLERHREAQAREREQAGDAWEDHGLVFATPQGKPIEPRNLVRQFKGMLKKAKLPESVRFHDLRHSCATLLIAQGVHPRIVMEHLRHAQISTTMNVYAHVLPQAHRDAAAQLDALLTDDNRSS